MIIDQYPLPSIAVQRHEPDLDDPAAAVWKRIESFAGNPPTCLFVNPIATVSCDAEAPGFFRAAREQQAKWCQRYKQIFGRRVVRSVKNWASWKDLPNRDSRYWDRAATFTGLLLINDSFIPPHQWPDRKPKASNNRKDRASSRKEKSRQQEKL
jgi:hypothetical protein